MAGVPIFHATVSEQAQLVFPENEKHLRKQWLQTLSGRSVEVIVRKERTQRSLAQNNWIHLAAALLAEHCGNSLAEMKLELMGACWGWHTLPSGHLVPVKIHTSDMTVDDARQFIDWLIQWSAEHFPEVAIPMPGEATA